MSFSFAPAGTLTATATRTFTQSNGFQNFSSLLVVCDMRLHLLYLFYFLFQGGEGEAAEGGVDALATKCHDHLCLITRMMIITKIAHNKHTIHRVALADFWFSSALTN